MSEMPPIKKTLISVDERGVFRKVKSSPSPDCSPRPIGEIGNYYGSLAVKTEDGKHYWSVENYDGHDWEEIPATLFDALIAFEDSKT